MLRSTNCSSQQEIISLKNSSLKPNDMNSSAKISNNNKKQKRKEEKNKKKNKKKRSSLAFWFCMGNKTDNIDKDRQPFPVEKDKKKGKDKSSKENKKSKSGSNDKKKSSGDAKTRQFEDKKNRRFSAPPTDWITMMATLENHNDAMNSGPNKDLNPDSKSGERSRSKSPGGVRYRFDGTLEKPYVYPGGLTFNSMRTPKSKNWRKRSSKKKGSNVVEAEIHHTDDEDGVDYDSDEYYDESDVRKHFYLRYDSHMKKKPSKKDRRYSMPAELQRQVEMETEVIGAMYGRGASRWLERQKTLEHSEAAQKSKDRHPNGEELYDEPYEGSDSEGNLSHLMAHSRPSSYYNSPPALQNSECVYMWHSCDDIPKCEVEYHSEEEVRGSRECLSSINNENIATGSPRHNSKRNENNDEMDNRNKTVSVKDVGVSDNVHIHDVPVKGSSKQKDISSPSKHDGVINNNSLDTHSATHPENTQQFHEMPPHNIPKSVHQSFNSSTHDLSDDVFNNSMDNANISQSQVQSPMSKNLKDHFVKNTTKPFDNPFRRNVGRSSCMPGNKRFFLPPPPTYTPPREEFELALGKMAEEERDKENTEEVRGNNDRYSRGSQADLTGGEDNDEDTLDMVEREKLVTPGSHTKETPKTKMKELALTTTNSQISKDSSIDKKTMVPINQLEDNSVEKCDSSNPSLRDDARKVSKDDVKTVNTSSEDSVGDEVLYINCPKLKPPTLSSSTAASSTLSSIQPSRGSSRRHTVMTSTPKAKRRLDLSVSSSTASSTTTRTPKRPVPTPRQRFSSCLEYSTVTLQQSSTTEPSLFSQQKQQQQSNVSEKTSVRNSVSFPISTTANGRPVAKKRLSQMLNSDSSYTNADIEEVLKAENETYYPPPSSRDCTRNGATRKELFSTDGKNVQDDKQISSVSCVVSTKPLSIREDPEEQGGMNHTHTSSSSSSVDSNTARHNAIVQKIGDTETQRNSNNSEKKLPPLEKFKLSRSPTATRRHFSSVFSSSVECLASSSSKSYYYSGLSSSLADIPSQLENTTGERVSRAFPYGDDDDHDDENADDEMSVHNEESPLPRTPSLEDLLRARSILDRSQAVCRKRRQRLRDRKCRSQILSSTEVDDYIRKEDAIRRRNSRHSSKKKELNPSNKPTDSASPKTNTAATTSHRNTFSFDHEITSSIPVQSRRFLYRQNRLLNHTDSGMDSDGASPFNSRDFQVPNREGKASPEQFGVSPLDAMNQDDISGDKGVLGTISNKESWEGRKYDRHRLNKTKSKEFLSHSRNSHHLDKNVSVSNGFETLV